MQWYCLSLLVIIVISCKKDEVVYTTTQDLSEIALDTLIVNHNDIRTLEASDDDWKGLNILLSDVDSCSLYIPQTWNYIEESNYTALYKTSKGYFKFQNYSLESTLDATANNVFSNVSNNLDGGYYLKYISKYGDMYEGDLSFKEREEDVKQKIVLIFDKNQKYMYEFSMIYKNEDWVEEINDTLQLMVNSAKVNGSLMAGAMKPVDKIIKVYLEKE